MRILRRASACARLDALDELLAAQVAPECLSFD